MDFKFTFDGVEYSIPDKRIIDAIWAVEQSGLNVYELGKYCSALQKGEVGKVSLSVLASAFAALLEKAGNNQVTVRELYDRLASSSDDTFNMITVLSAMMELLTPSKSFQVMMETVGEVAPTVAPASADNKKKTVRTPRKKA